MAPSLGNPVLGVLHPLDWPRPAGNTDMKVTQDAASHAAQIDPVTGKHRPMALDIGDGDPDRDTLIAAHDCKVVGLSTVGSANLTLEFTHEGVRWRLIYAHDTLPHPVVYGQVLRKGDVVGRMGNTSSPTMPVAIHLHWQIGYWNGLVWVWVDPWPLLAQNQGADMIPIPTAAFTRLNNKKTTTIHAANFWAERVTSAPILRTFPIGTVFYPMWSANDGTAAGGATPTLWFYGPMYDDSPAGYIGGWIHSSNLGPLVDATPPPAPIDCGPQVIAAVAAAVLPLNEQIVTLTTDLGVANGKITRARVDLA